MKVTADILYAEEMLREAMEMLEDFRGHMGLFQRQQYGKLKRRFDQHVSLSETIRKGLNEIDAKMRDEEGLC